MTLTIWNSLFTLLIGQLPTHRYQRMHAGSPCKLSDITATSNTEQWVTKFYTIKQLIDITSEKKIEYTKMRYKRIVTRLF